MATRDLTVRAGWLLWVSAVDPSLHSGQKKHTISAAPMFVPISAALVSAMQTYYPQDPDRYESDGSEPLSKDLIPGVLEV